MRSILKIIFIFYQFFRTYQDFLANRNKTAISVDGEAVDEVGSSPSFKHPSEVPSCFYSLHYLAKAPRNGKNVFKISFLMSAGAFDLEGTAIAN